MHSEGDSVVPAPTPPVDLGALDLGQLEWMRSAGFEAMACQRALAKTGDSILGDLLRFGPPDPAPFDHYPAQDVFDPEFYAQFYYHRHPDGQGWPDEHGHFHLFVRGPGQPIGAEPVSVPGEPVPGLDDRVGHIVALGLDTAGLPHRLFATNRWVTSETWMPSQAVVAMADGFCVDHAKPSWPLNRWVTAMVRLFHPQIAALAAARDRELDQLTRDRPLADVFEDREIEVLAWMPIDIDRQIEAVNRAWRHRRRSELGADATGA